MWWLRKVRRADIPQSLRDRFEQYSETVLSNMLGVGALNSSSQGPELIDIVRLKRAEMLAWLTERRDIAERREQRMEAVEWAVLIFVVFGVFADLLLFFRDHY